MKKTGLFLAAALCAVLCAACGNDDGGENPRTEQVPCVYAAGIYDNQNSLYGRVWKDGQPLYSYPGLILTGMAFMGDDLYVTGYGLEDSKVEVWKNDLQVKELTDGTRNGYARALVVEGPDWYTLTEEVTYGKPNRCRIWKNGEELYTLSQAEGNVYISAGSICVSNGTCYAAGFVYDKSTGITEGIIWRNGEELYRLASGSSIDNFYSGSIGMRNNKIYVAGLLPFGNYTYNITIWEDGTPYATWASGRLSVSALYLTADDIYVGGNEATPAEGDDDWLYKAKIWKNGTAQQMESAADQSEVTALCVAGTDCYAGGYELDRTTERGRLVVWKNGTRMYTLTDWCSERDIFKIIVK